MKVVAVSDLHMGFDEFNKESFERFLDTIEQQNLDKFLLVGDIFDYWRGGIETIMANNADIITKINQISQNNTDVVIIAGNHDWRLVASDEKGIASIKPPWNVKREYEFTSGDREFIAKHGHQFDLANANAITNRLLCLTDDDVSTFISSSYSRATTVTPAVARFSRKPQLIARPSLATIASLSNPNILAEEEELNRSETIKRRITSIYDKFVIFGHTHRPSIGEDYVNTGCWTLNNNTYAQIENGTVDLRTFS